MCWLLLVAGAPVQHKVASLPGWDRPLPSQMYSGYVNVTKDMGMPMMVHYWFILCQACQEDHDPTILWTNGGPGASSMFGLLVELGPLLLNENSIRTEEYKNTGVPTLFPNDFAWTKLGSIVMFDWPPPVGFSYCNDDPTGDGNSCGEWDDDRMAKVSYAALSGWFELFPERKAHPLYLTGESYAGIYVPKLAEQIVQHAPPEIKFKGFAVGDGCLGTESGVCGASPVWWQLTFLYGHHQISTLLYEAIIKTCGFNYLKTGGTAPQGCSELLSRVAVEAGGYFAYSLYDDCIYEEGTRRRRRLALNSYADSSSALKLLGFNTDRLVGKQSKRLGDHNSPQENSYVCAGDTTVTWSESSAVRKALNVPTNSAFFNGDNGAGMTYHSTEKNVMSFYQKVAQSTDLRVMLYSGDTDPAVNSFSIQNWTLHLGYSPTQTWRPWTLDGCRRMGGYVTRYKERFDFLTIRGAGHMVPQYKPEPAFEFLRSWLANEDYKTYNASCVHPA